MFYTEDEKKEMEKIIDGHQIPFEDGKTPDMLTSTNANVYHPDFLFGLIYAIGYLKQADYQRCAYALEDLAIDLILHTSIKTDNINDDSGLQPIELANIIDSQSIINAIEMRSNINKFKNKPKKFIRSC